MAQTEGSYLGDLKSSSHNEIATFISPKNLSNYQSGASQKKNNDNMSSIQEVSSSQSIQNKLTSSTVTTNKLQQSKHVNPAQNIFASPFTSFSHQQNQPTSNSFQQSKTFNDEQAAAAASSFSGSSTIQDKGKYFQSLFNNLFLKDGKKKPTDKMANQTPDQMQLNGSSYQLRNNAEKANNLSQNNEVKQKQVALSEYASSDQKLEELPSSMITYSIKDQLKQQNNEVPQIKTYAASAETTPIIMTQNYIHQQMVQSPAEVQSHDQTKQNSVTVSPFNQMKSLVLRSGDDLIDRLREVTQQRDEGDKQMNQLFIEPSSLNSSAVQIKNRQSLYSNGDNQGIESSRGHQNIIDTITGSLNNISFAQYKPETISQFSLDLNNLQAKTSQLLSKQKERSFGLSQALKEQSIRISELNQALQKKDIQFERLTVEMSQLNQQVNQQQYEMNDKDNFIAFLKNQIQELINESNSQQKNQLFNNNPRIQTVYLGNNQKINVISNIQPQSQIPPVKNIQYDHNSSPQLLMKETNKLPQHNINQYYGDEELSNPQKEAYQVRYSLPVFSKGYFGYNSDTPSKKNEGNNLNNGTPSRSSQQDEEESADFTGNKDCSLDSLKRMYQVNSSKKKYSQKFNYNAQMFASKQPQQGHNKNSQNENSQKKEEGQDPLNDSTQLLKVISKKSQDYSSHSASHKDSALYENGNKRPSLQANFESVNQHHQFNLGGAQTATPFSNTPYGESEECRNTIYFGNQGSFSNLQSIEKQPQYEEEELMNKNEQTNHRSSEALTSATPSNSQNITLSQQYPYSNNQREKNRLFSLDQDDQNSANQINANESFNNGGAYFGGSNDAEQNNQENSFSECCFGQQVTTHQQSFSQQDLANNSHSLNQQNQIESNPFGIKINSQEIISISSKSSYCMKTVSDNNSPNLNNSFSKKSVPQSGMQNCASTSFQQQNPLNDSFNLNSQRRDEEEIIPIPFANQSFSQIPLGEKNNSVNNFNNNNNNNSENYDDQVNISFEGFGSQVIEQGNSNLNNNSDNNNIISSEQIVSQRANQENEIKLVDEDEQQQGISFTNQSFG